MKLRADSLKRHKIDKSLANLIENKRERTQKIKSEMKEDMLQSTLQK